MPRLAARSAMAFGTGQHRGLELPTMAELASSTSSLSDVGLLSEEDLHDLDWPSTRKPTAAYGGSGWNKCTAALCVSVALNILVVAFVAFDQSECGAAASVAMQQRAACPPAAAAAAGAAFAQRTSACPKCPRALPPGTTKYGPKVGCGGGGRAAATKSKSGDDEDVALRAFMAKLTSMPEGTWQRSDLWNTVIVEIAKLYDRSVAEVQMLPRANILRLAELFVYNGVRQLLLVSNAVDDAKPTVASDVRNTAIIALHGLGFDRNKGLRFLQDQSPLQLDALAQQALRLKQPLPKLAAALAATTLSELDLPLLRSSASSGSAAATTLTALDLPLLRKATPGAA